MTVPEVNASFMHALMITAHAFMIVTVEGPGFHMCICDVTPEVGMYFGRMAEVLCATTQLMESAEAESGGSHT